MLVERDIVWKDWQTRYEEFNKQGVKLDTQLQTLEASTRMVKRSQETFEEMTTKFDRRINEITEMQRLVEDRFRQEWVNFKSDDQKRWTNYILAQEEQARASGRSVEKYNERLVALEDLTQEFKDMIDQITEDTEKRLQNLLALMHQWVDDYARTFGNGR